MAGWEQTIIIGNVGRDPEMRYLQNGTPVCSFSVATTRKWNDSTSKEQKEKTTWRRVTCWRKLAETANTYVHKGMQIMVVGEEEAHPYLDTAGQPAATLEMTAQNFQFLGAKGDGNGKHEDADYIPGGPQAVDDVPF